MKKARGENTSCASCAVGKKGEERVMEASHQKGQNRPPNTKTKSRRWPSRKSSIDNAGDALKSSVILVLWRTARAAS